MDQERYVAEPNQVLHPGKYRRERYNDTNGAVHETTRHDAHGNAFTENHRLGPAERYDYDYVVADAPEPQTPPHSRGSSLPPPLPRRRDDRWSGGLLRARRQPRAGGSTGGEDEDDGPAAFWTIIVVALLALGPLFLGAWMIRRAKAVGGTAVHGRFVLLLEIPWLAALWGWLFDGGGAAWTTAVGTAVALGVRYGLNLRDEARWRRVDTGLA